MRKMIPILAGGWFLTVFAFSEAQAPQEPPKKAKDLIHGLYEKLKQAQFKKMPEKEIYDTMVELEQTAQEMRDSNNLFWLREMLKAGPKYKILALKTIRAIRDETSPFPVSAYEVSRVLDDADDEVRVQAAITLWNLWPYLEAIPKLTQMTKHKNPAVRHAGIATLGKYGQFIAEVRKTVIGALDDGETIAKGNPNSPQVASLYAISTWGPASKDAVPGIIKLIENDKDYATQYRATLALARIAPEEPILISTARKWIKQSKEYPPRRRDAIGILSAVAPCSPTIVSDLVELFEVSGESKGVYYKAHNSTLLGILRKLGPKAKAALPALERFSRETNDSMFRGEVETTIKAIRAGN